MDCIGCLLAYGLFAMLGGSFATYLSIAAWRNPNSPLVQDAFVNEYPPAAEAGAILRFFGLTRERAGQRNLKTLRVLGLIIGPIFVIVGFVVFVAELRCPNVAAEFTSATRLQFKF